MKIHMVKHLWRRNSKDKGPKCTFFYSSKYNFSDSIVPNNFSEKVMEKTFRANDVSFVSEACSNWCSSASCSSAKLPSSTIGLRGVSPTHLVALCYAPDCLQVVACEPCLFHWKFLLMTLGSLLLHLGLLCIDLLFAAPHLHTQEAFHFLADSVDADVWGEASRLE